MKNYAIQTVSGCIGAVTAFMFGEISIAFSSLIALICIDFITGLMHAYLECSLNSKTCAKGIVKKVYILALVAVGHLVDNVTGAGVCMNVVTFFYIANEAMSVIENAGRIGLPIPEKFITVLEQLNGKEYDK